MKKNIFIISLLFATVLCSLCLGITFNEVPENIDIEVQYTYEPDPLKTMTSVFNEADNETKFYLSSIENSTGAAVCKFVSVSIENQLYYFEFERCETVYGDIPEKIIRVPKLIADMEIKPYGLHEDTFKVGKNYLLFLLREDTVALSQAQYTILGNVYIPMDSVEISTWSSGIINFGENTTTDQIKNYYKSMALERGYNSNQYQPKVFRNQDLKAVIQNSDGVYEIKVLGKDGDGVFTPSSNYNVEITKALKGGNRIKETDYGIYIINCQKDALEKGKEYIIAVSMIGNTREQYTAFYQSAENGIIPIEDTETVEKVYEWLNLK